jgi:hypothetical protein
MMLILSILYVAVVFVFLAAGYVTTPRKRLHLGLFILASLFWPLSLLMVIGVVCAERIGAESRPARSRYDRGELTPARAADLPPRHKLLDRASG